MGRNGEPATRTHVTCTCTCIFTTTRSHRRSTPRMPEDTQREQTTHQRMQNPTDMTRPCRRHTIALPGVSLEAKAVRIKGVVKLGRTREKSPTQKASENNQCPSPACMVCLSFLGSTGHFPFCLASATTGGSDERRVAQHFTFQPCIARRPAYCCERPAGCAPETCTPIVKHCIF